MTEQTQQGAALAVRGLSITVGGDRCLFDQADLRIEAGTLTLLVGPSGSGKSTLLRAIAGLHEPDRDGVNVTGGIELDGLPGAHDTPRGEVGLVFQDLALFDELSVVDNIQFALDHRHGSRRPQPNEARQLLQRLAIPDRKSLASLSGGERQRVAVARALAMAPPILLFDEPTTGLDPRRTLAVADLIHETHRAMNKTVVVVTHDFAPFLPYAPRLILLDQETKSLREVDVDQLRASFDRPVPDAVRAAPAIRPASWAARLLPWLESPGRALLVMLACVVAPLRGWRQPKWRLRYLWHYVRMVAGGTTSLYVAIAAAMLGFVTVFFAFSQFPHGEVTIPLLTEEFLAATGFSAYRVLVPLLIALLMAGKCGASIAADVGARRVTHQLDALRNLGIHPDHLLYGNMVIALLVAGPWLTAVAYLANCLASLVAFLMTSSEATVAVFSRNYFATVWPAGTTLPDGSGWVLLKAGTSGVLIAALAYAIGARPKASSVDVGRDVGLTIFWTSLGVLLLHTLYSFVEF